MGCALSSEQVQETVKFHGHWCPGLAIGIRASEWALDNIGRAGDEEVVTVVETDMCAIDAIQYLISCTVGKGNLIQRDLGKVAFTFYRRRDEKAMRLLTRTDLHSEEDQKDLTMLNMKKKLEGLNPDEKAKWHEVRERMAKRIMDADFDQVFEFKEPNAAMPKKAFLLPTLKCQICGEPVMESRARLFQEQIMCIPCFKKHENRFQD